jgi:predicted signal transduction protein with EAL and GGDEF domain
MEDALLVAERIRHKIESEEFVSEDEKKLRMTVSLGVAAFRPELNDMKELIAQADAALYFAQQNGRNQVACMKDGAYRSVAPEPGPDAASGGEAAGAARKHTHRRLKPSS